MIDFRYHLVSVIAIFLALALGIVVGTTALNGGIVDNLKSSNKQVISDKRNLESAVQDLRTQVTRQDDVAAAVAAKAVSGRLSGQRVVILTAPGASTDGIDALRTLISQAGGTPSGLVRIKPDLLDPAQGQVLDDLVASVAPPGVTLPEGTPTDRAATVLAAALMTTTGAKGISTDAAAKILGGFTSADFIDLQRDPQAGSSAATLAVLLTDGGGKALNDAGKAVQRSEIVLARALDAQSEGLVVAGPDSSADIGGLIAAVRDDDGLSDSVTTVDTAETSTGRLVVVLALAEQASGGAGRYGQGPGARSGAPAPAGK
ncbi:MAG: copper transporter [Mycobacteriales bacterium]